MSYLTAAANAKGSKDSQFKATQAVINKWAKIFRANGNIPDALLDQLMLAPHKPTRTSSAPAKPTSLQATADGQGLISLKWSRTGNTSATQFVIEYRTSSSAPWAIAGSTNSVKFDYQGTAGTYIAFRVYSQKKTETSAATAPLVFWENSGLQAELKVA